MQLKRPKTGDRTRDRRTPLTLRSTKPCHRSPARPDPAGRPQTPHNSARSGSASARAGIERLGSRSLRLFSRPPHSTALPPLRGFKPSVQAGLRRVAGWQETGRSKCGNLECTRSCRRQRGALGVAGLLRSAHTARVLRGFMRVYAPPGQQRPSRFGRVYDRLRSAPVPETLANYPVTEESSHRAS
jgi:hypothetical protein